MNRSYLQISISHLKHLGEIAIKDQEEFFKNDPKYKHYQSKMKAILLIQGAALHYVNGINGIKDFDLLVVYSKLKHPTKLYAKRLKSYNSNLPEFGRYPSDKSDFETRKVDILMRAIDFLEDKNLNDNLHDFIASHKYWNQKAAIGIWPQNILGKVVYSRVTKFY